jgi:hypothetical protein
MDFTATRLWCAITFSDCIEYLPDFGYIRTGEQGVDDALHLTALLSFDTSWERLLERHDCTVL